MSSTNCLGCCFHNIEKKENTNDLGDLEYSLFHKCKLDKYKQYKLHKIQVTPTTKDVKLKDFVCPFKRTQEWSEKFVDKKSIEDIEKLIINENGFPYSVFIYENKQTKFEELIEKFLQLDHKPAYIHLTFKYMHQDVELLQKLSNRLNKESGVKYKLVINMDKDLDHFYESYLAFRLNVKTPFVAICNKDFDIPTNTTTKLSEKIQKDLFSFPYANTKNNEMLIFPVSILEEYISFEGPYFIDKILETQCQNYKL